MSNETVSTIDSLAKQVISFVSGLGFKLVLAVIIVIIGLRLIHWITKKVGKIKYFDKLDTNLNSFLQSAVNITLHLLLIIAVCNVIGINTASLITVIASCGVAIGLAMQGALSNVAGGLMILLLHPFHVGDYVEVANVGGTVRGVSLFSTTVTTPDNKTVIVPNGSITSATIINYSSNGKRRVDMTFTAGYDVPVKLVKSTMMEVIKANHKILKDPEPFVRLTGQGASALEYTIRVWTKTDDYWDVHFDLMESMTLAFQKKGINIPYPQMDVHIAEKPQAPTASTTDQAQ